MKIREEKEIEKNVIEVKQLTKRFGEFTAVNAISFQVQKGEIFGFLGANGAGKTTAMRMLTGLSKPTSGDGWVAGFNVTTEYEKIKKGIGYMSQKFSLYNDLTIRENIRFFGGIYGLNKGLIKSKTSEILEELDLSKVQNKQVASLPLGWKQRLAFAVSMLHEPQIVFLDEPTGGVDPSVRRQFWEAIYAASAKGITIFVTTHYMDEAEYCHRVSIMVNGEIKALDTPQNLKKQMSADSMEQVFIKLVKTTSQDV
ncbi:ABC transporter ATP-binding protein [Galbibacter sp. BG1]|uniref:ABC transporter ATP-binding protein n=1 Tax=Galbibacter sp. BG1 TaxID=1170699 RepID=UPI0015BB7D9E|nr:ABC transporter ATP-binding protein [Galbibacter sp. BG1]QLE00039.1 ABC transporter ATP-binding protein [Galbibacter sp. BG1]